MPDSPTEKPMDEIVSRTLTQSFMRDEIVFSEDDDPAIGREIYNRIVQADGLELWDLAGLDESAIPNIAIKDIPQFSSLQYVPAVVEAVAYAVSPFMPYQDIGYQLDGQHKKPTANQKFGENHFKLCEQLGLTYFGERGKYASVVGKCYLEQPVGSVIGKLTLRVPFIRYMILRSNVEGHIRLIDVLREYLSETTARRRRSSIQALVDAAYELHDIDVNDRLDVIDWRSLA